MLTEQEILQDALIAHKFLIKMYCQYGIECSSQELRTLLNSLGDVASSHDLKIFNIMNQKGFYPTTPAPASKVNQTIKMHTKMEGCLEEKLCKDCGKKANKGL